MYHFFSKYCRVWLGSLDRKMQPENDTAHVHFGKFTHFKIESTTNLKELK